MLKQYGTKIKEENTMSENLIQKGKAIYKNYNPLNLTEEQQNAFLELLTSKQTEESTQSKLKSLQSQIASTDYQIIKCYEYSLVGLELPYDIEALHADREAIREQIRELEETN